VLTEQPADARRFLERFLVGKLTLTAKATRCAGSFIRSTRTQL
jgi:hypothetical protein